MRAARYLAWAGFGAAACWAAIPLVYRSRGPATIDFAVDPPPQILSGVYDAERTREGFTWVWSRGSFSLSLEHLDRSGPWRTTWRLAAQRADGVTPELVAAVDGVVAWRHTLSATGFVEEQVDIPARAAGSGRADRAVVTMTIAPTFVPGGGDSRTLGAQIDYVQVEPIGFRPWFNAPTSALLAIGAALGLVAAHWRLGWLGAAIVAAAALGAALITTKGLGPFVDPAPAPVLISSALVLLCAGIVVRGPLSRAAGVVVLLSAAVTWLKLAILTHPDMPIGDAMFHAHRFQDVLAGRFYFTSVTPGDIQFPYAIALYLTAAAIKPLAAALDHMLLLRLVVVVTDSIAAVWLYRLLRDRPGDGLTAAGAVAAYHLLPLTFNVVTTGNLTNMFGQSLAIVVFATAGAMVVNEHRRVRIAAIAFVLLASVAFLSHTSTFAVLFVQLAILGALVALWRRAGTRAIGLRLLVAAGAAAAIATVLYYAHFMDVYQSILARVASETGGAASTAGGRTPIQRLAAIPEQLGAYYGVIALVLAALGVVELHARRLEPLRSLAIAWLGGCAVFLTLGVITPVDMRHYLAALPALAMLIGIAFGTLGRRPGWGPGV
ncbi:MAG TPA: hypothetical protein VFO19_05105, partial [Vicinamibacterales bacterium]|nr:hypothetical protein [Vicinamibacterales bacterium]